MEPGTRPSRAAHYTGWAASQAAISAALREHAPIDGLLGFSQGATAAALFLAHAQLPGELAAEPAAQQQQQQQQQQQRQQGQAADGDCTAAAAAAAEAAVAAERRLRFAVLIAGFLPRDAGYADALRRGRPVLPSLHVWGAADALVPEERSRSLMDCFQPGSAEVYQHPGAHMVRGWAQGDTGAAGALAAAAVALHALLQPPPLALPLHRCCLPACSHRASPSGHL